MCYEKREMEPRVVGWENQVRCGRRVTARPPRGDAQEAREGKGATLTFLENSRAKAPEWECRGVFKEQESLRSLADNHPFICSTN